MRKPEPKRSRIIWK